MNRLLLHFPHNNTVNNESRLIVSSDWSAALFDNDHVFWFADWEELQIILTLLVMVQGCNEDSMTA